MSNARGIRWSGLGLLAVLVGASAAPIAAGQQARSAEQDKPPRIVFSEISHDFGTIRMGPQAAHVFTFRNGGGAELRLQPPSAS